MKKSSKVALTLLPAFAAMFIAAGCDDKPADDTIPPEQYTRACLDPDGNVVDNKLCEDMYDNRGVVTGHNNWFFYWYYLRGGMGPRPVVGSRVVYVPYRGSFTAPEGAVFSRGASVGIVSRGGFGSTGMGHAAGE